MNEFDILNNLGEKEYDEETINESLSEYLLITYLRHNPQTLYIANILNSMKGLKDVWHKYQFAFHLMKAYKIKASKWVKSNRTKKSEEDIIKLATHFGVTIETATKYLSVLSEEELQAILEKYQFAKVGKNNRLESVGKVKGTAKQSSTPKKKKISL